MSVTVLLMNGRTLGLILCLGLCACGESQLSIEARARFARWTRSSPESLPRLRSTEDWQHLAVRSTDTPLPAEEVKFVFDRVDGRLLFFDGNRWPSHGDFARGRLSTREHPVAEQSVFQRREYLHADRRFELGAIVHYTNANLYALELLPQDNLDGTAVVELFQRVARATYFGAQLRYRAISPTHREQIARLSRLEQHALSLVEASEIFQQQTSVPITRGVSVGFLRVVRSESDLSSLSARDIAVFVELPETLPLVAGVVTRTLQAPLSHLAMLTTGRGTPNLVLRDVVDGEAVLRRDWRSLEGQLVRLEVTRVGFDVRRASSDEAERDWAQRRPTTIIGAPSRTSATALRLLCSLRIADAAGFGAKAAQLGEACSLKVGSQHVVTAGGFAVPVGRYLRHRDATGVSSLLANAPPTTDSRATEAWLTSLRAHIASRAIDPELASAVQAQMSRIAPESRWIFRSSSNIEDLPGFSAAGLYQSVVVPAHATPREIESAIVSVWTSLYSTSAFREREWHRIDESAVAMGVLAQPFLGNAIASGVAITANPLGGVEGFLVNVQGRHEGVTSAEGGEIPEQHLLRLDSVREDELLSLSSSDGQILMHERDSWQLAQTLAVLHAHFVPRFSPATAIDVEFLLTNQHQLVVLQVRPWSPPR